MSDGTQPAMSSRGLPKSLIERLYASSRAADYGLSEAELEQALVTVSVKYCPDATEPERIALLESLHHEKLALTRGCAKGNEKAWEIFLTRYRASLYSSAYSVARNAAAARDMAASVSA